MRVLFYSLLLATIAGADTVQLTTGKTVTGRVTALANDAFTVAIKSNQTTTIPAANVAAIDFVGGSVKTEIETRDKQPLTGVVWLFARGSFNFEDTNGESTRIPLAKIAKARFGDAPPVAEPPPKPVAASAAAPTAPPTAAVVNHKAGKEKVKLISRGENVDILKHCVDGKVTIVDFYAEWCGPCRQAGPVIERYVENDPDLVLRKIDIVKWGTPVCDQFDVHSIPRVQVYGRSGKLVGEVHGFDEGLLQQLVKKAKG